MFDFNTDLGREFPAPYAFTPPFVRAAARRGRRRGGLPRRDAYVVCQRSVHLLRPGYHAAKRLFDLGASLLLLTALLPIMACCAAAIWLDDGRPILFSQLRTGRRGERFRVRKFRTMVKNAEELKSSYRHLNQMSGPEFKLVDDPRITRVGRWLRRLSLDELPQLINVVRGEMSLVGPRPTSFPASDYALWQTERLEVLPGITGLAQVSGRSELSFEQKLRLDLEYIARRGFWFDLLLLFRTVPVVFGARGAY